MVGLFVHMFIVFVNMVGLPISTDGILQTIVGYEADCEEEEGF